MFVYNAAMEILYSWKHYRVYANSQMRTNTIRHTHRPHGKWEYNASDFSVNFSHCVRNNRHTFFGLDVCAQVSELGCLKCCVYGLRSEGVAASVLHAGGELEVGDANVVVTAVQENVRLRGRGGMRKCLRLTRRHHESRNRRTEGGTQGCRCCICTDTHILKLHYPCLGDLLLQLA